MLNSVKIGRNIDILLKEYERFLTKSYKHYPPSNQVYHPQVRLDMHIGEQKVSIEGLKKYKATMWIIRGMLLTRYFRQQPKLVIDKRNQPEATNLHVQWSVHTKGAVRWEGISEYDFEPSEGRVTRHVLHSISPPPGYWLRFMLYWFQSSPQLPSPTFCNKTK